MRRRLSSGRISQRIRLGLLGAWAAAAVVAAESVALVPVADTALIEAAPANNLGGNSFFNAGTTATLKRNRGLIRFDPAAVIAKGSNITNVSLTVEVTGEPLSPAANSNFTLHRLLRPWGEGNKVGQPGALGLGQLATLGEATWTHRLALTTNAWMLPGGAAGEDYVAAPSASIFVYGADESPYTFSGGTLTADVQDWLDRPEANFGWLIMSQEEATAKTARRFAAREDVTRQPRLHVDYAATPRISSVTLSGDSVVLRFTAEPGVLYTVEYQGALASAQPWSTLTNLPVSAVPRLYSVTDPIGSPRRFYRLSLP